MIPNGIAIGILAQEYCVDLHSGGGSVEYSFVRAQLRAQIHLKDKENTPGGAT